MVKRSILSLLMVGAALGTGAAAILSASFVIILGLSWWLALAALLFAAQSVVVAVDTPGRCASLARDDRERVGASEGRGLASVGYRGRVPRGAQ